MFELLVETGLILEITSLIDDLVRNWKASMDFLQNHSVDYRHISLLSDFSFKFKEIFVVSVLKLRILKVKNIKDHSLILHLKSISLDMKLALKNFIVSFDNKSDEFLTPIKNFTKVLEELEKFII